jgi:hypothetical protein
MNLNEFSVKISPPGSKGIFDIGFHDVDLETLSRYIVIEDKEKLVGRWNVYYSGYKIPKIVHLALPSSERE